MEEACVKQRRVVVGCFEDGVEGPVCSICQIQHLQLDEKDQFAILGRKESDSMHDPDPHISSPGRRKMTGHSLESGNNIDIHRFSERIVI
jgi:hypothetical protein